MCFKKIISLTLAAIFISMSIITAYALNNEVSPCFENFYDAYAGIEVNGRNVTCIGRMKTNKTCQVEISLLLQKSSNGTSWSNYKTLSSGEINTGLVRSYSDTENSVQTGYYYRTKATITVQVGNSVETTTVYSAKSPYIQ